MRSKPGGLWRSCSGWNIFSLPGVQMSGKALCKRALDVYVDRGISFADAYTAITMQAQGVPEIYSWDRDFDHIDGLNRVEPEE